MIGFNDGKWQGQIASFGLASSAWIKEVYGGEFFFHPTYHAHFADVELTLIARQMSVYAYNPNSVVMEIDWEKDEKSIHIPDRKIFAQRKKNGFDGLVLDQNLIDLMA